MATEFPQLFAPLELRGTTLRNRVVMLPMGTRLVHDGQPTEEAAAFYEARAAGGVGLVLTGGTDAHETTVYRGRRAVEAYDDSVVPALARLAEAVHAQGAKVFGQLAHLGREYNRDMETSEWPAMGPSALPGASGIVPHEMTISDIDTIIDGYGASAANFRQAGYDGIEIQANHGYLAAQFLATRSNHRRDHYGGSLKNRMRFLFELVDVVRERIGSEHPVGVRLSADEEIHDGLDVAATCDIVRALDATAEIDYLSLSFGLAGNYVKDMSAPAGVGVERAARIKRETSLPVIVSQRIVTPHQAEAILDAKQADLIGLARALITDPHWPTKANEGRSDEIRPCVGAVQGCHTFPIGCIHNAEAGRERNWRPGSLASDRPSQPRRIVVVGGGPAGLECARVAATRGHEVTLLEQQDELGGQVRVAALGPGRSEIDGVIEYRKNELSRLGVEVALGASATAGDVVEREPDSVVIATGARPRPPDFDGAHLPHVLTPWDLLEWNGRAATAADDARTAVVVDDGSSFWEVYSSAEALAERGVSVHFVTPAVSIVQGIPKDSQRALLRRLRKNNVQFHTMSRVVRVTPSAVIVYDSVRYEATSEIEEMSLPADAVVVYAGKNAEHALVEELQSTVPRLHSIGDCVAPRRIREAILDGYRIGRDI